MKTGDKVPGRLTKVMH